MRYLSMALLILLAACKPEPTEKVVYIIECTSWKSPGLVFRMKYPDPEHHFSGNGFLGFDYYTTMRFRDLITNTRVQIHENDGFACTTVDKMVVKIPPRVNGKRPLAGPGPDNS